MGMLDGKVSEDDIQRVRDIRNPPQYEAGFESSSTDNSFNMDDLFGTSDDSGFGGESDPFSSLGSNDGFGSSGDPFGGSDGGFGSSGDPFGGGNNQIGGSNPFNSPFANQQGQMNQSAEPGALDKAMDLGVETAKNVGSIIVEMGKSFKLRSADDFGYLSRNSILTGVVLVTAGTILGIIGTLTGIGMLSFTGIGTQTMLAGGLLLGFGLTGIGVSALVLEKIGRRNSGSVNDITDVPAGEDNFTDDYEDNIDSEIDSLFSDDEIEDMFGSSDSDATETSSFETQDTSDEMFNPDIDNNVAPADYSSVLNDVHEGTYITRELLFDTFKRMFPTCTADFAEKKQISNDSADFITLETICLKALANLANCSLEEIDSKLVSVNETRFVYSLKLKRINKVTANKTEALAREIEVYVRDSSEDDSINATVDIEGDFYKIIITKGNAAVVTFGDIFKQKYCCDFFLNNKNKLPMVIGIDELGKVILDDAKNFDTMLIAGKPRSGKSWYVLSILAAFMLFNTPEDVQFCIVDPKESNLFKTISLMPHVIGLHNDRYILNILDDIIEVEAPRRKRLLEDNESDDIWALRKKGIKLPVLYVVIDEYITVINNLDAEQKKEFNSKIQVLISQLPSQGIRLLFVPHRATGIVDKTNRSMIQYTAAVRANTEDILDTLDIKKWDRALTEPGDLAVKSSMMKKAIYARGAALTNDDNDNAEFIKTAAKIFYKMGVDIPDMSHLQIACNRDEEKIKEKLSGQANTVQFDADRMEREINNMDFSNI